ncbi:MAG: type 1 glutamine amidotransferase [Candidatus Thiodiazotropha taylori]|nr:type 1 glutamine amidotransferase [Candidatus Thiodiazotropha taylori]
MKPIRIFRHMVCKPPGYLGDYLHQRSVPWEMVCVDEANPVPQSTDDVSALVFMGAGVSVNDQLSWMEGELALIRKAIDQDLPILGICFGAQMISRALGGEVTRGDDMEIGWHPVRGIPQHDPADWLQGLPEQFMAFHWHADTFTLPAGSRWIMESDCYPHQGFALGDHLGLQFHLEMTESMIRNWIERYGSDLETHSSCRQSVESIVQNLDRQIAQLHEISAIIYGNWLNRVLCRV